MNTASFDEVTGVVVVVVGFGFVGGAAAIAAADAGRQVVQVEKMSVAGDIAICSGGRLRVARDEAKALQYLGATNADTTPHGLPRAFAREMTTLRAHFESLARFNGATVVATERPASYPLPGWDTFEFIEVEGVPGFDPAREYPHARSLKAGINAFKIVHDNVRGRPSIDVPGAVALTTFDFRWARARRTHARFAAAGGGHAGGVGRLGRRGGRHGFVVHRHGRRRHGPPS